MNAAEYVGSPIWQEDRDSAEQNFKVTKAVQEFSTAGPMVAYVEAEAKTGSRYVVVGTRLNGTHEDGVLISVLQPWQNCYVFNPYSEIDESQVLEHLADPARKEAGNPQHAGDIKAMTMTANEVMAWLEPKTEGSTTLVSRR